MKQELAAARLVDAGGAVRVEGDLTFQTVNEVLRDVSRRLAEGSGALTFDFSALERSDSAALALLLELLRRGRAHGRSVVYRNLPERLLQLARISDLDELLRAPG